MSDTANQGFVGQRQANSGADDYNSLEFVLRTFTGKMATATLGQVSAVYPGADGKQGLVDVQLLVNTQDALGNATPHGVVTNLPYLRVQGGARAVKVDPEPGDIGLVVFANRDISSVKSATNVAKLAAGSITTVNPGSFRRFSYSDGVFVLTALGTTAPTDYVELPAGGGVIIHDRFGNDVTTDASGVTINGVLFPRGGISFNAKTHTHHQPNDSHGDTEQPTNAPTDGS